MSKDFGGGISDTARRRTTRSIESVRGVVKTMETMIDKEREAGEKAKRAKRSETPAVVAEIKRVEGLLTKKNGVLSDAVASFTRTVNDLKGDVTHLTKLYSSLPKGPNK